MDIKNTLASLRQRFGSTISFNNKNYFASITDIDNEDPDFMPSDNHGNALNTEQRRFTVNPDDFSSRPNPGEKITWDESTYIILDCRTVEFQSQQISLRITAYKSTKDENVQNENQLDKWKRVSETTP